MQEQKHVLLVEDNVRLNEINRRALELEGYTVMEALSLEEARTHMKRRIPDIILLDILLPDGNGVAFCREIRETTAAPILFLTSVKGYEQALAGLAAGGDDYLTKPYAMGLLLAKVAAFLRRDRIVQRVKQPQRIFERGALRLDVLAGQAFLSGENMMLPPKDFALLYLLAQNEGKCLAAEALYAEIWKLPDNGDTSAVKNAIYRLRKKLDGSSFTISTRRDAGYCFEMAGKEM